MDRIDSKGRGSPVTAVTSDSDETKITLRRIPDQPGIAARILEPVAVAGISVDMIIQNVSRGELTDFTFTVDHDDAAETEKILQPIAKELGAKEMLRDDSIAKVSMVGSAMQEGAGIASRAFRVLADGGINIQMISTSDRKIAIVIDSAYTELAVRILHKAFDSKEND